MFKKSKKKKVKRELNPKLKEKGTALMAKTKKLKSDEIVSKVIGTVTGGVILELAKKKINSK